MIIIMFGPPGSGKGTQSANVAKHQGYRHVSTGDLLREEISQKTPLGQEVASVIAAGDLVSDDLILAMVERVLNASARGVGIVFDGFPRTVAQAKGLAELLERHHMHVDIVFDLQVTRETILDRIRHRSTAESRTDDNVHALDQRFQEYDHKTAPVLAYYQASDAPVVAIDGLAERTEITKKILHQLTVTAQEGLSAGENATL